MPRGIKPCEKLTDYKIELRRWGQHFYDRNYCQNSYLAAKQKGNPRRKSSNLSLDVQSSCCRRYNISPRKGTPSQNSCQTVPLSKHISKTPPRCWISSKTLTVTPGLRVCDSLPQKESIISAHYRRHSKPGLCYMGDAFWMY